MKGTDRSVLVLKVEVSELCTLNPELLDHINAVNSRATDPPPPAQDKVTLPYT